MKLNPEHGKIILRIFLSLVFLWFGINQVYAPAEWVTFVPDFVGQIIPANTVVIINGSMEILFGLMMISGFYLRLSSLVMGIHLFFIALSMGMNVIAVRDYGLTFATLALFFLGPDKLCIDARLKKKEVFASALKEQKEQPMQTDSS